MERNQTKWHFNDADYFSETFEICINWKKGEDLPVWTTGIGLVMVLSRSFVLETLENILSLVIRSLYSMLVKQAMKKTLTSGC